VRNFVGGARNSGMITVNPKNDEPKLDELFKKAKENFGARSIEEAGEQQVNPFTGQVEGPRRIIIKFFKGVFTVNDGPPRSSTDEEGKAFHACILDGRLPPEFGADDREVEIIDNKNVEYQAPPRDITKLEGTGQSIGGSTEVKAEVAPACEIKLDSSQPMANIRVRFADGTSQNFKFNLCNTIRDVRAHIEAVHPCGKPFALKKAYPPAVLENFDETLEEAGLKSASLVQETICPVRTINLNITCFRAHTRDFSSSLFTHKALFGSVRRA